MAPNDVIHAINATIACSAILGNGIVIFVMTVRRKQFNSFTNRLIRHQSIIDFIAGVIYLLSKVIYPTVPGMEIGDYFFGELQCRFVVSDFFIWTTNVASSYNLVVISLERFLAMCYPVKHRNYCSLVKIRVLMFVAWTTGLINAIKFPIMFSVQQGRCVATLIPTKLQLMKFFMLMGFPFEFFIPVGLITFSYARIFLMIRRKLDGSQQNRQRMLSKAKRNVIETMLIAGILFLICWSPFQVLKIRLMFTNSLSQKVYVAFTGLLACNICVNPIIYCFKYDHFRVQIGQLVRNRCRRNHVQPVDEANDAIN